jgi:hypothetical protein
MIASSDVETSEGGAAKLSWLSSALDSESAGASSNVSVDMAGINSSFFSGELMTVDLQIRAVQLDSDDQHLVEAPGMPKACQIERRALHGIKVLVTVRRVAAFRNNSGIPRQRACPD